MSRFHRMFAALRAAGRKALMPYITAGDPTVAASISYLSALAEVGVDAFELGVPFSDPLADGPTLQEAADRALRGGVRLNDVFHIVAEVRRQGLDHPIALLIYYNCIHRFGVERFAAEAAAAGVDGLIVPDLPFEEAGELRAAAGASGLDFIPLLAPTSTDARIQQVGREPAGFVYCVSVKGVTGARTSLPDSLGPFLTKVRRTVPHPLAIGFGIAAPEQAREVSRFGDGVIVGSALVERLHRAGSAGAADEIRSFVGSLRQAIDQ